MVARARMARRISIYLNDHLVIAAGGTDLVKRMSSSNEGTELGDFLESIAPELEADRDGIEQAMELLDVRRDPFKRSFGWGAEKLGRLKLNGQLTGYSPLSRLVELEGMTAIVNGNLSAWQSLAAVAGDRVAELDLPARIKRCEARRAELERFRVEAAREALAEEASA
jgi:hypothetical protein